LKTINTRQQPVDPDYRGIHTFALLKVSQEKIVIQYFGQDGVNGYTQTWS